MAEAGVNGGNGLLAGTNAGKPIGHVAGCHVIDTHGRNARVVWQQQVTRFALLVNIGVVFVIAIFVDDLVAGTTFVANIHERGLLAHVAGGTRRIVAEAGGVAHEEALGIFEQGVESVGIFATIGPGKNATVSDDGAGRVLVSEPVDQIDGVAHPLIGDAAGEFLVEAKFAIEARVERAHGLVEEPALPVRIGFAELGDFRASAPARAMIIPDNFNFRDVAEFAAPDQGVSEFLVRLAAMLRANLDDEVAGMHGVAGGFGFREDVAHGLFDVNVLAGFSGELQKRRVGMIGSGDDNGVDVLLSENLFGSGEGARGAAILLGGDSASGFAIDRPKVADSGELDVVVPVQLGGDFGQIAAAAANADMAERDAVVGADNTGIGQRGAAEGGSSGQCGGGFVDERAAVHAIVRSGHVGGAS